jgi:hypothetical protein
MKEAFIEKAFRPESLNLIHLANSIIDEYRAQGYTLTLRQLYYQLVARDHLRNTEANYKKLGNIISDARLAGLVDWEAIEDRTRSLSAYRTWYEPESIVRSAAQWYMRDLWEHQPFYCEVWVEKEALAGVVARACQPYRVPYFSCRGYVSQSEMYTAAMRLKDEAWRPSGVRIIHLGDHDPSGIDMSRDINDRLALMMGDEFAAVDFRRIALNFDQIAQYKPPPNPAKSTDSRFAEYRARFGKSSWELDALEPSVMASLIERAIRDGLDVALWDECLTDEAAERQRLESVAGEWDAVMAYLEQA